jgi:signal transduction histidine kinase
VVLTAVQRARRSGTTTVQHLEPGQAIVLTPADVTVTFTFAALNFTNSTQNQYSWQLDGFDPRWSDAGTARTASYTNLPPGHYTFRVRGSNDDGRWNEEGLAAPVIVEPAYWQTVWFRAGLFALALLLASGATALVQRNRHRRELDALAYHQALDAERARISRDMHDELGAGITEIAMLSELAQRHGPAPQPSGVSWHTIAERARALIGTIGEIIWAITPEHDSVDRLGPYLREYTSEFLEHAGLRGMLHFDLAAWPGDLHADFRRNLFLILKESLTNVVRHAGARTVEVTLEATADMMTLVVRDDGSGLTAGAATSAAERGHQGLANLERRAAMLGGAIAVIGTPGSGTTVTLRVPAPGEAR